MSRDPRLVQKPRTEALLNLIERAICRRSRPGVGRQRRLAVRIRLMIPPLVSLLVARPLEAQGGGRAGAIGAYDLGAKNPVQFDLGRSLREISGLAMDDHGRLFAHQDERGIVFELAPGTGKIVRTFHLGRNGVRGDFEGIATVGRRMFLVSSGGTLVEFAAGMADSAVDYVETRTTAHELCREVEGLDYDAATDELLLACKYTSGRERRGRLIVLGFSLVTRKLDTKPRFDVSLDALKPFDVKAALSPSGIAIHPLTGTLFVVAARQNVLIEMNRAGSVLGAVELPSKVHHQAEGIAFGSDGTMYIADEGRSGRATLTVYRPDPARLPPRSP